MMMHGFANVKFTGTILKFKKENAFNFDLAFFLSGKTLIAQNSNNNVKSNLNLFIVAG
jgi:hypothetical protein